MTYKCMFECGMIREDKHMFVYYCIITYVSDPITRNVNAWDRAYKYFKKFAKEQGLEIGSITMCEKEA